MKHDRVPQADQASAEDQLRASSPGEFEQILEAERAAVPFLLWRAMPSGPQRLLILDGDTRVTVGRSSSNSVVLVGDPEASRVHAALELIGDAWVVEDGGLSRNGTFVNGVRLGRRRRLSDGDVLRCGQTFVQYRHASNSPASVTLPGSPASTAHDLTDVQRRILVALCRPYRDAGAYATPASNRQIAEEVFLGVDAVKTHLRRLFQRFGIVDLPQNKKRAGLVELAFQLGIVTERDL